MPFAPCKIILPCSRSTSARLKSSFSSCAASAMPKSQMRSTGRSNRFQPLGIFSTKSFRSKFPFRSSVMVKFVPVGNGSTILSRAIIAWSRFTPHWRMADLKTGCHLRLKLLMRRSTPSASFSVEMSPRARELVANKSGGVTSAVKAEMTLPAAFIWRAKNVSDSTVLVPVPSASITGAWSGRNSPNNTSKAMALAPCAESSSTSRP